MGAQLMAMMLTACTRIGSPLPAGDGKQDTVTEPAACSVVGSIPYWAQEEAYTSLLANRGDVDHVSLFWYHLDPDGEVRRYRRTRESVELVMSTRALGLKVLGLVANLPDDEREGKGLTWDPARVRKALHSKTRRAAHVGDLVALARRMQFDGILIDYEALPRSHRQDFSTFIEELGGALRAEGRLLAVAIHSKTSEDDPQEANGSEAQDWDALARHADQLHFMTYSQHTDTPGPAAELGWARRVLRYAVEERQLPREKIFVGLPLYASQWSEPEPDEYRVRDSGLTFRDVEQRRTKFGATERWSADHASPYVTYRDRKGTPQIVWYENARSSGEKLALAASLGLCNFALWRLGGEDPEFWRVLHAHRLRPSPGGGGGGAGGAQAPAPVTPATPDEAQAAPGAGPDTKPDGKPEAKPDGKPEAKPDGKPEAKPDGKPEAKPDGKPEALGEPASEPTPAGEPKASETSDARGKPEARVVDADAVDLEVQARPASVPAVKPLAPADGADLSRRDQPSLFDPDGEVEADVGITARAGGRRWPSLRLWGEMAAEVEYYNKFGFDRPEHERDNFITTAFLWQTIALGKHLKLHQDVRVVLESDGEDARYYSDFPHRGIYLRSLQLHYERGPIAVFGGRYEPGSGLRSRKAIFFGNYSTNLELYGQLGGGASFTYRGAGGGRHSLTGHAFRRDTSPLRGELLTNQPRDRDYFGEVGEYGPPDSYLVTLDGSKDWRDVPFGYALGGGSQTRGEYRNQDSVFGNVFGGLPLGKQQRLRLSADGMYLRNARGSNHHLKILGAGAVYSRPKLSVGATYSIRFVDYSEMAERPDRTDRIFELVARYAITPTLITEAAFQRSFEWDATEHALGIVFKYLVSWKVD